MIRNLMINQGKVIVVQWGVSLFLLKNKPTIKAIGTSMRTRESLAIRAASTTS